MSNEQNAKPGPGDVNGATITISQHPEGLAIGLEFHGKNVDEKEREGMQALAFAGVEAMRDWIRDRYDVKSEEVLRRRGDKDEQSPIH